MSVKRLMKIATPVVGAVSLMLAMPASAADGEAVYNSTCKMCHATGMAGAPKVGDKAAWADRIAQGTETLHTHAINGFKGKGFMPPKGGKSSLSDDEVKAAVDYMVEASK